MTTLIHDLARPRRLRDARGTTACTRIALAALAAAAALLSGTPLAQASTSAVRASAPGRPATAGSSLITITGAITWKQTQTTTHITDTQTGSFNIDLTSTSLPGTWDNANSSYQVTDQFNATNIGDCLATITGSASADGSFPSGVADWATFNPQSGNQAEFFWDIQTTETRTETSSCGTSTYTVPVAWVPECWNEGSGLVGTFTGANGVGTIQINCSGTYNAYTYSANGTLTVSSSCGSAASPPGRGRLAAASSCGLSITSPPAGSIIAATDPKYLTPQPGPKDRQPEQRSLTVKGNAPASDSSITLNGQQVPVHFGTWTAQIPVTMASLGQLTLTASDANTSTQQTITLIDLEITSPTEDAQEPITATPAMPELNATVSAAGYPGDTSNVSFNWALDLRGRYIDRKGWHAYPTTQLTGSQTGIQTPWNLPQGSPIVGGVGRLSVSADLPGVLDDPVRSEPRWINIPGTNPAPASVNSEVAALDAADAGTIEHIFCWESGGHGQSYPQFNPATNKGEKAFANIPGDWTPNPPVMQPHYGAPPAGIGIAQDDPATFPGQQWDWTQNVSRGVQVYQQGLAAAQKLRQDELNRLKAERKAALKVVNAYRAAHHLPKISVPLIAVPPEPAPYSGLDGVTADAITRYNTGARKSLFYFDYHYLASADDLHVTTLGSGQWIKQDGRWQTVAQWQDQGGIHTARAWRPNPAWNPSYPNEVEGCTPPQ